MRMQKRCWNASLLVFVFSVHASAQTAQSTNPVESRTSTTPLRDVQPKLTITKGKKRKKPVRRLPFPKGTSAGPQKKPSIQRSANTDLPILVDGFEGIGTDSATDHPTAKYNPGLIPPDTVGAAGEKQYVQWVNTVFAVFDKATHKLEFIADGSTIWRGYGGKCETNNDGDPIVLYDKQAHRWVLTQFVEAGGAPFSQCIAVSQTDDAGGLYYRYAYDSQEFDDYPKFGTWSDGYYASFNSFKSELPNSAFLGGKVCAFERDKMLEGKPARRVCFTRWGNNPEYGFMPADIDGAKPPPEGSPEYYVNLGANSLKVWRFHVDWGHPEHSEFVGPTLLPVDSFAPACQPNGACVPQKGTDSLLDVLSDRVMYRAAYRNAGAHGTLLVTHDVAVPNTSGGAPTASGIRWYELHIGNAGPEVHQQGTYAPGAAARWMGSAAMDSTGDILIGYSVSSDGMFPSIAVAGRSPGDPAGLSKEVVLQPGAGAQDADRWGDYSSLTVDPVDDCTFWYTTEFLADTGVYNWHTFISKVRFAGCTAAGEQQVGNQHH